MNTTENTAFNWDKLLDRLENREVIPVIGEGLYTIKTPEGKESLLYHYLADQLAGQLGMTLPPDTPHPFAKAAFAFLHSEMGGDHYALKRFLADHIKQVTLLPDKGLQKLAAITCFNLFINTTYDSFLAAVLKATRTYPTREFFYSKKTKNVLNSLNQHLSDPQEAAQSLVFNIYGNLQTLPADSAYTEADILETIFSFQDHLTQYQQQGKTIYAELNRKALLFIGCGYDDWLFRFFIRALSTQPYVFNDNNPPKFLGDQLPLSAPPQELHHFLKFFNTEIYYTGCADNFIHQLFDRVQQRCPAEILTPAEGPPLAFISFTGADRAAALQLAAKLKEDGLHVWVDKNEFAASDPVDKTIIEAINKCPVFIPLLSATAKTLGTEKGWGYHYQEWKWVEQHNLTPGTIPKVIIPVSIDDTRWDDAAFASVTTLFKQAYTLHIPGGCGGDYAGLREALLKVRDRHLGGQHGL